MADKENVVTIGISDLEQTRRRVESAFRGKKQGTYLTFASVDLLWRTMTPRRWHIVQALAGQGPMSLRGIARLMERDVKTIHGDVHALLDAGMLEKTKDGRILFPFDFVHVDFTISRAA